VANIIFNLATDVAIKYPKSPHVAKIESRFAGGTEKWPFI
jgi:hypothetical protein